MRNFLGGKEYVHASLYVFMGYPARIPYWNNLSQGYPFHIPSQFGIPSAERTVQSERLSGLVSVKRAIASAPKVWKIVINHAEERHCEILGCLLYTAKLVAKQEGLEDGFRIVINDGPKGSIAARGVDGDFEVCVTEVIRDKGTSAYIRVS
ncbi:hypothetical protein J1N35_046147 [Gossypium stocksii]|uniref:Uncharacterized protein n=1 Tax=Gossypium stocksii TaxID=47602 RepID=A0A9D3U5F9_9ROSI|nr:hypothetical protein J1N35_046147 [Gossypium stocksii]